MTKKKKTMGRPVEIPSPWKELANAVGGKLILAEKLGVADSTINRWARRVHEPSELTKKEVRRLCDYYHIEHNI